MNGNFDSDEKARLVRQYHELAVLAGGLAHEIRNPISTMRMNLELIQEDLQAIEHPGMGRVRRKISTVQSEFRHLEAIVEAFLDFARAGEIHPEPVDLSRLILEAIDSYQEPARAQSVELRPRLSSELPSVFIDRQLFRQVLDNLLRNALQATSAGGVIEIQSARDGDCFSIDIIDTGRGISAEQLPRIFDHFFTTSPGGNGLGLPTVKKIVETHGGAIHCDSATGKGTRFHLSVPIRDAQDSSGASSGIS